VRVEDRRGDARDARLEVEPVDRRDADAPTGAVLDHERRVLGGEEPVVLEALPKELGRLEDERLELAERRRLPAFGDEPVEALLPDGTEPDDGAGEHGFASSYIFSGIGTPRTPRTSARRSLTSWSAARRARRLSSSFSCRIGCVW